MSQYSPVVAATAPAGPARRRRFADLSLRSKILALVGVAVLSAVGLAVVAQTALASLAAGTDRLVREDAVNALQLADASNEWGDFRRLTLRVLLAQTPQELQAAQTELLDHEQAVTGALDDFLAADITDKQRAKAEALRSAVDAARTTWHEQLEAEAANARTPAAFEAALADIDKTLVPLNAAVTDAFDELNVANTAEIRAAADTAAATASRSTLLVWAVAVVAALLLVGFGWWIALLVARPVAKVQAAVEALADGDLTRSADVDSRDEVGRMADALSRAQGVLRESMTTIMSSSTTLAGSAEELSAVSAQVAASAEETSVQSGSAAAAAEQVSRNVQTVAAATEQMTASIREISQSSTDAVRVAQAAADEAQNATGTVAKLGDSSKEIGDVVKVITSIAEQTNLLALNATIEAARAGEAGKGFAVVASEVKDLAQETARATEDISRRIEAIQSDSEAAVAAIARISEIIEEVNSYQTTIASAVEEQTATTGEMARNVSEAASGAGGIAGNIEYVATAAQSSSTGIVEAQRAAAELAQLSGDLRELVSRFTV